MPFTEHNINNESFGETKTFSVTDHSADSMKERINRDNSQILRGREAQPASGAAVGQMPPGPQPARQPEPAEISRTIPAAEQSLSAVKDPGHPLPESVNPDPGKPGPVPERSGAGASAGAKNRPEPDPYDGGYNDKDEGPEEAEPAKPRRTSGAGRRISPEEEDAGRGRRQSPENRQMTKTRTSEFKVGGKKKEDEKTEEDEYEPSDEGGNTVLSVIKAIIYIIFVLVSSVAISVFGISIANDMYAFVKSDESVTVTIPPNTTLDELAQILKESDVIRYPRIFKYYALHNRDDMAYVEGEYTVTPMMNYSALLDAFKEKEVTGTVRITIPEGYTTDDIIDLFVNRYGIGTREGFVDVIQNGEFDYWFIRQLDERGTDPNRIYRLDGYLFPDTYEFYLNSSEKTVINRLLRRFGQIFTREYRDGCEALGFTVDQVVTLASMIEKEAAAPSEFFDVASVFLNRLKVPDVFPRMESDATVVYAIEHNTGERTVDLSYDSPYNTYLYAGLPPGPIANPSASAILSVLIAQESPYYYFVSDGSVTYFAVTKEEHDQNIENIRQAGLSVYVPEPVAPPVTSEENP